jgi:hypothetical protein
VTCFTPIENSSPRYVEDLTSSSRPRRTFTTLRSQADCAIASRRRNDWSGVVELEMDFRSWRPTLAGLGD